MGKKFICRGERLISTSKLLSDTITEVNLPKFGGNSNDNKSSTESTKTATRRLGLSQRDLSMKEILHYNHATQDILFDGN